MNKYQRMNKILEEQGVCEQYLELETEFADAEKDRFLREIGVD